MLFYMQRTDGKTHNFFGYNPNLKLNGASDGAFKVFKHKGDCVFLRLDEVFVVVR